MFNHVTLWVVSWQGSDEVKIFFLKPVLHQNNSCILKQYNDIELFEDVSVQVVFCLDRSNIYLLVYEILNLVPAYTVYFFKRQPVQADRALKKAHLPFALLVIKYVFMCEIKSLTQVFSQIPCK